MQAIIDRKAVADNDRVFGVYLFKLAHVTEYEVFAGKFTRWLNSEKAYYPAARPQILRICQTAYATIIRHVCRVATPALITLTSWIEDPLVIAYIRMIRVLARYSYLFVEQELLPILSALLASDPQVMLPADITQSSSQSPSQAPPSQPMAHLRPVSSIPQPSPIAPLDQPRLSTATSVEVATSKHRLDGAGESSTSIQKETTFKPANAKPKKKKKRPRNEVIDFEALAKMDLEEAKRNAALRAQEEISRSADHNTAPASAPTAQHSLVNVEPVVIDLTLDSPEASPMVTTLTTFVPAKDEIVDVPLPPPSVRVETSPVEPEVFAPPSTPSPPRPLPAVVVDLPPTEEFPFIVPESELQAKDDIQPEEGKGPLLSSEEPAHFTTPVVPPPEVREQVGTYLSVQLTPTQEPRQIHHPQAFIPEIDVTMGDVSPRVQAVDATTSVSMQDEQIEVDSTPLLQPSVPSLNDIVMEDGESHATTTVRDVDEAAVTQTSATSAIAVDSQESQNTALRVSPQEALKNDAIIIEPYHATVEQHKLPAVIPEPEPLILPTYDHFGEEMSIIEYVKPDVRRPISMTIKFEISDAQYSLLSSWINRDQGAQRIEKSMCISLACYVSADALKNLPRGGPRACALFNTLQSTWPNNNLLSLNALYRDKRDNFPLAPPIVTTPENCLDLSPFLVCGHNELTIRCETDMTRYLFVLHAHHPTKRQLQNIAKRREQDWLWRVMLKNASRPLDIPPSKFASLI